MENSGLCFTVPFWSLGSQKLSVVLNYSVAHIFSVSKKSTPTGKKCHKLFIALCFRSRVAAGSRAASLPAGENPCWPLGINVLSGRGRSRVVHGLVSGEEIHSSGTCPATDLPSSFYGARKWHLTHPGLSSDQGWGGTMGWGWSRRSIKNSQGLAAFVLGIFFITVGCSAAYAGNDSTF